MKGNLSEWQVFSQEKRLEGLSFAEIGKLWRERDDATPSSIGERRKEFSELFERFVKEFADTDQGRQHLDYYKIQREEAEKNFEALLAAHRAKEDITDRVILKLLPYTISPRNEEQGAWQCNTPSTPHIDLKAKFEGAGWAKPEDWPEIAKLIFGFVRRCVDHPEQLFEACQAFATSDYATGLQSGSLSPILNALRPDDFAIVSNKTRKVLKELTGRRYLQRITDYPNSNAAVFEIVLELEEELAKASKEHRAADIFDAYCHWLVTEEKHFKRKGDDEEEENVQYWKIAPGQGAKYWDLWQGEGIATIGWNELGDVSGLTKKEFDARRAKLVEQHDDWTKAGASQVWAFSRIQVGDRIVANKGMTTVLGIGTVTTGYTYDPDGPHHHRLKVQWDDTQEREIPKRAWRRSLVKLSEEEFNEIIEVVEASESTALEADGVRPLFSLAACSEATGFSEPELTRWVRAIERKGQAILYGPPGTGKTYVAQMLADHLVGGGTGDVELIQLHSAYAYEDFIQGLRPVAGEEGTLTYDVVPGRFLEFCRKAEESTGRSVLILDEINRADLSRVLGELMFLLEYRDKEIPLAGGGRLTIPASVRIIGTMNTADRSIALVDHALRRRFAFLPLYPNFDVLESYHAETGFPVERLVETLKRVNAAIGDRNYEVGVSFFLLESLADHIEDIWRMEIEPYLEEYFFDSPSKVDELRWDKVRKGILG